MTQKYVKPRIATATSDHLKAPFVGRTLNFIVSAGRSPVGIFVSLEPHLLLCGFCFFIFLFSY